MERFKRHTKAVGKGVQGLREIYEKVRNARLGTRFPFSFVCYLFPSEMSTVHRLLSYGFLSLITSKPIAGEIPPGLHEEEEEETNTSAKGLMNRDGAWCWREDCEGGACMFYNLATADHSFRMPQANEGNSENG